MQYRGLVSEAADSTADDVDMPLSSTERIAALDAMRGFALPGIFIMNMPGFTHSLFAAPKPEARTVDAVAAPLRDLSSQAGSTCSSAFSSDSASCRR